MTIVTTEPDHLVAAGDRGPGDPPSRRRRAAAVVLDALAALAALLVGSAVAIAWLLVRTAWGRDDVASGDARIALALILATTPAWAAWEATRARRGEGTIGQARLGLRVAAARAADGGRAPLTRLALHPLAIIAWLWLASLAALLQLRWPALLFLALAGAWWLAGAASVVALMRVPPRRPLHDRLAHTTLLKR